MQQASLKTTVYNYGQHSLIENMLIEEKLKTLIIVINFSFCQYVVVGHLLHMCRNFSAGGKILNEVSDNYPVFKHGQLFSL